MLSTSRRVRGDYRAAASSPVHALQSLDNGAFRDGAARALIRHAFEGADSIQTTALAIKCGMTYRELGAIIFPHLTTVEG